MSNVSASAAPIATTGVPAANHFTAPAPGAQAAPAGNAAVGTTFDPAPVTGGGDVGDAISRLVAGAHQMWQDVSNQIASGNTSEGQPLDAAKLQAYSSKMTVYEMTMQMAAKLQEKEERAASVWLRP